MPTETIARADLKESNQVERSGAAYQVGGSGGNKYLILSGPSAPGGNESAIRSAQLALFAKQSHDANVFIICAVAGRFDFDVSNEALNWAQRVCRPNQIIFASCT